MDSIISTKGVTKAFPVMGEEPFYALKGIDVEIPREKLTILKGRSGSGKTTLINMLGALDNPTEGSIIFEGVDLSKASEAKREAIRRKRIGFVFQSVSLIPMMTALENVEFVLRMAGIKEGRKERAMECLKLVGLGNRMNHMPEEMSGGEQQRVAIARAVAHRPLVIFADEPTAELDSQTALSVVSLFKKLVEEEKVTIIMTTHDTGLMGAGDCVYEIDDGIIVKEST